MNRAKLVRISLYLIIIISILSISLPYGTQAQGNAAIVYVIPLEETVEMGLFKFLERSFKEAIDGGADHILIEMNTYGGAVKAADEIGRLFQSTTVPITVFVDDSAISAGAYIALNADNIVMTPTAKMGAATVVDMEGTAADAKSQSMWISNMVAAAETHDRDPLYARAMVDPEIEIEGLVDNTRPLTFTANEALQHGYAEALANSRAEVLAFLELEGATIIEIEETAAEKIARFITHPVVGSILLSLASLGLILELYSPGFGIPGLIGLSALFLFFFGHMIAGFAGIEALILAGIGIVFIVLEIFTAGFGLFGILGLAAIIASLAMASVDVVTGLKQIGVSIVVSVVFMVIMTRYLNKRGVWNKLVLQEDLISDEGKLKFAERSGLIGKQGRTLNKLRPSGTVKIDGRLYDVVSQGIVIEKDRLVEVIMVEGTRIVVQEVDQEEV